MKKTKNCNKLAFISAHNVQCLSCLSLFPLHGPIALRKYLFLTSPVSRVMNSKQV